ncbi:hypothetical protein HDU93_005639 [Gonapodya sp. JEL0774]|nr:hypothetical protein HDU93_005639 [Gonapodya sp. JEL0774]
MSSLKFRHFDAQSAPDFLALARPLAVQDVIRNNQMLLGLLRIERDGVDAKFMACAVEESGEAVLMLVSLTPADHLLISHPVHSEHAAVLIQGLEDNVGLSLFQGRFLTLEAGDAETLKRIWPAIGKGGEGKKLESMVGYSVSKPLPPSYPARDSRVSFLSDAGHLSVLHDWHLQFIKETGVPAPQDPFTMFDKLLKDPGIRKAVLFTEDGTPMSMAFHRKVAHPLVPRIGMVYTPPEFRNRGASTRLMSSLVREILEEDGVSAAMLMADPHASAWRVYEKVGFTKCGDFSMFQIG